VTRRYIVLLVPVLIALGCNRSSQTKEAVRQGIIDYLSTRSNLDVRSMQVDVTAVTFRQKEADATVSFRPKGGDAGAGMEMRYTLEQRGNKWVVKGRDKASGANPHGGMGQMPGAPPSGEMGGSKMPAGHPPIGGANPSPQK
jgi:hypothetical protein